MCVCSPPLPLCLSLSKHSSISSIMCKDIALLDNSALQHIAHPLPFSRPECIHTLPFPHFYPFLTFFVPCISHFIASCSFALCRLSTYTSATSQYFEHQMQADSPDRAAALLPSPLFSPFLSHRSFSLLLRCFSVSLCLCMRVCVCLPLLFTVLRAPDARRLCDHSDRSAALLHPS